MPNQTPPAIADELKQRAAANRAIHYPPSSLASYRPQGQDAQRISDFVNNAPEYQPPQQAAPAPQAGIFRRTDQSGASSSRMMSTFQDERLGPHEVAIPLIVPGNESLAREGQGGATDERGIPIPGGRKFPGRGPSAEEKNRAIEWAVRHPEVVRHASDYKEQALPVTNISQQKDLSLELDKKTQEHINTYMNMTGGDAHAAAVKAYRDRKEKYPNDVALRNAEHTLSAHHILNQLGPVWGRAGLAVGIPAWSAYKQIFEGGASADPAPASEARWSTKPMFENTYKPSFTDSQ